MKKVVDDERLIVKICDMYYNQDLNQKAISAQLGLSRPTVSRMLASARKLGIVKITINNVEGTSYVDLERQIENRFDLREVIIVGKCKDSAAQKDAVGKAAAQYLERVVRDNDIIGVSMGSTLGCIARHIEQGAAKNLTFVPLIGGMGHLRMEMHSNYLVEDLARAFDGRYLLMHAPARVSGRQIRDELLKEEGIRSIIKMGDALDVALVGIGVPNSTSAIMATGYYNRTEMERMREKHVAGDICMQFYDINGNTATFKADNNVVGVDIKKLRRVAHSIGVACGEEKAGAVKGAVAGRYINTLVTDVACAHKLLEM